MKYPAVIAAVLLYSFTNFGAAAEPSGRNVQHGRLSTARLIATARISGNAAPDGMRFLFLITRMPEAAGQFTLKETRDFLLDGSSYQEKTRSELGQSFEPGTMFDSAGKFFSGQPGLRKLAPEDIKDAYILSLTIGGAKLSPGAKADVTIHVGFDKQVEPFTFRVTVPSVPGRTPKT